MHLIGGNYFNLSKKYTFNAESHSREIRPTTRGYTPCKNINKYKAINLILWLYDKNKALV